MCAGEKVKRMGLGPDLETGVVDEGEGHHPDLGVLQRDVLGPDQAAAVPDLRQGVLRKARAANLLKKLRLADR